MQFRLVRGSTSRPGHRGRDGKGRRSGPEGRTSVRVPRPAASDSRAVRHPRSPRPGCRGPAPGRRTSPGDRTVALAASAPCTSSSAGGMPGRVRAGFVEFGPSRAAGDRAVSATPRSALAGNSAASGGTCTAQARRLAPQTWLTPAAPGDGRSRGSSASCRRPRSSRRILQAARGASRRRAGRPAARPPARPRRRRSSGGSPTRRCSGPRPPARRSPRPPSRTGPRCAPSPCRAPPSSAGS